MTSSSYRAAHPAAQSRDWGPTAAASHSRGLPLGVHSALDEFPREVQDTAAEPWDPTDLPQPFCAEAPPCADGVAPWDALEAAATGEHDYTWEPPAPPLPLNATRNIQAVLGSVTTRAAAHLADASITVVAAVRKADLRRRAISLQRRMETLLAAQTDRLSMAVRTVGRVSPVFVALALTTTSVSLFALALWQAAPRPLPAVPRDHMWAPFAIPVQSAEMTLADPLPVAAASALAGRIPPAPTRVLNQREAMRRVQQSLNRYRDALSILDARAVKQVWPTADERATRDQFAGLRDQNVEFDTCRISVSESTANAVCSGTISYVRAVRAAQRRTESRRWTFTLANQPNGWRITRVVVSSAGN